MASLTHCFAFDPLFRFVDSALHITPDRCLVRVDDSLFTATFGYWSVSTPITNIAGADVTGPYSLAKVIGGPHVSFSDGGLTFATNRDRGVCIKFRWPVRGLSPFGWPRHGSLTVTVERPAALAEALDALASPSTRDASEPIEASVAAVRDDLSGLTAAQLRQRASELGLRGVSRLSKAELLHRLVDEPESTR